jgi:hypothetical protein
MRKYAVPGTYVPGATPMYDDPNAYAPMRMRDNKGRPLWNMPKPVGTVENIQIVSAVVEVDGQPRMRKVRRPVSFPVYRGVSAALARYIRADMRRRARKAAEKQAEETKDA